MIANRLLSPVQYGLSRYRGTALLLALVGATAIGAFSAVTSLGTPVPRLLPDSEYGVAWTSEVRAPAALQREATRELHGLLVFTGWCAIAVAGATLLVAGAGRASERRVDVQVRRAVGARRRDLVLAALLEGLAVVGATVLLGLAIGMAGARWAAATWPGEWAVTRSGGLVAAALIGALILIGAFFPLARARTRRIEELPPAPPPLTLIGIQLAAGLAVLVAGSLVRERVATIVDRPAIQRDGEGTVYRVELTAKPAERSHRYAALLGTLASLPGVEVASLHSPGALSGLGTVDLVETECGNCYVGGIFLRWRLLRATYHFASADTFYARGVRIGEGRSFTPADSAGSGPVVIVNRYLAGRYFENGQAVGRDLWLGGRIGGTRYRVVGVVDDGRPEGLGGGVAPREALYLSVLQHPGTGAELLIRPAAVGGVALRALERTLGITSPTGESESAGRRRELAPLAWFARWFGIEGAVVLGLAIVGVFGMMQLWIRAVRPELAVRRAVGARRRHVLGYTLGRAAGAALHGVAIAVLFIAPFLWAELERILPGVRTAPVDLVIRYGILLIGAALAGALVPALLALRRPPATDLGSA